METNELMHFGIRGMKWGVRRFQNKDGTLTAAGKARLDKKQIRTEENLIEKTIPKGTTMYRVTPHEKDGSTQKSKYVTYLEQDRNLYKEGSVVKSYIADKGKDDSVYEHRYQLKTDVKIPSLKTVREIEEKVVSTEKARDEVAKSWVKERMIAFGEMDAKSLNRASEIAKQLKNAHVDKYKSLYKELCKEYDEYEADSILEGAKNIHYAREWVDTNDYLTIERSLGMANNVKNGIIKELKKLGYNAMYDNAGIGVKSDGKYNKVQEGVEPLIIFDSDSTLQSVSTRKINTVEQKLSATQYEQWKKDRDKTLKGFQ